MGLVVRRLFEGGHYNAQPWDCAAPIRGRLLKLYNKIRQSAERHEWLRFAYIYIYIAKVRVLFKRLKNKRNKNKNKLKLK